MKKCIATASNGSKNGSAGTLARPMGRYVGASVSYHTRCGLMWLRLGYNSIENVVVGMNNTVSVVT